MAKIDHKKGFGGRISDFIDEVNYSRKDFATLMDITYDKLQSYIQEKAEPRHEFWELIQQKFPSTDITYIITGKSQKLDPNIDFALAREIVKVPIVNDIPASGFVRSFEDMISEDYIYTTVLRQGTFALRIKGDSMSPRYEDGDLVILYPDVFFENGKVYAIVANDSEATLKTVYREGDILRLVPSNKKFPEIKVHIKDVIRLYRVAQLVKVIQ